MIVLYQALILLSSYSNIIQITETIHIPTMLEKTYNVFKSQGSNKACSCYVPIVVLLKNK